MTHVVCYLSPRRAGFDRGPVYVENVVDKVKAKNCPITVLNKPTLFQEVKAPRFLDIDT